MGRVAEQEKKAQKGKTSAERAVGRLDKMKEQDIAESEEQVSSNQNQETKKDQQQQNQAA